MIKLNIGCGILHYDGEIGVDKYPTKAADVIAEIDNLPYENGVADFIRLDHILEHIETRKVVSVLSECYRVLCTGGTIRVGVPDFLETCRAYVEATNMLDKYMLIRNFYGSQVFDGEYHKSGWDRETLNSLLTSVGFKNIVIEPDLERSEGICIFAVGVK